MSQYAELVKALRWCADESICCDDFSGEKCPHYAVRGDDCNMDAVLHDAAAAIEALQAELEKKRAADCWGCKCEKVEPKRGEWLPYEFNTNGTWHKCSVCGVAYQYKDAPNSGWWINHNYCPNCGAKMNGEQNVE